MIKTRITPELGLQLSSSHILKLACHRTKKVGRKKNTVSIRPFKRYQQFQTKTVIISLFSNKRSHRKQTFKLTINTVLGTTV